MERKRVYTFGNGQAEGKADMRNLLGGKVLREIGNACRAVLPTLWRLRRL